MTYKEIIEVAKDCMFFCKACLICNGKVYKNSMQSLGDKGIGDIAIRNYDKWKEIRLNMDTIAENKDIDTSFELLERNLNIRYLRDQSERFNCITATNIRKKNIII